MGVGAGQARAADDPYADPAEPAPPRTDMTVTRGNIALVITDPQVDFVSPRA